jgi:hypothetical protein
MRDNTTPDHTDSNERADELLALMHRLVESGDLTECEAVTILGALTCLAYHPHPRVDPTMMSIRNNFDYRAHARHMVPTMDELQKLPPICKG